MLAKGRSNFAPQTRISSRKFWFKAVKGLFEVNFPLFSDFFVDLSLYFSRKPPRDSPRPVVTHSLTISGLGDLVASLGKVVVQESSCNLQLFFFVFFNFPSFYQISSLIPRLAYTGWSDPRKHPPYLQFSILNLQCKQSRGLGPFSFEFKPRPSLSSVTTGPRPNY